ncbi:calcyphosin-like protein [Oscarella lobularis]|uniref:calcyphosin-like protein n=1 Tax=Oscarella lobularis TaxID=121494 RepID=UPI0033136C41
MDPIVRFREMCLKRGAHGIKSIGRQFRIMDDDGSRTLNYDEFRKGVHDFGLTELGDGDLREMFSSFDRDGSGTLDYEEFLRALRPPMSDSRIRIVEKAFAKADKTGDGVLTVQDLKGVYDYRQHQKYRSGDWTADQVFENFLDVFDSPKNKDHKVTKDEFMDYYAGLSNSIDNDAYFDLMIRQAWRL